LKSVGVIMAEINFKNNAISAYIEGVFKGKPKVTVYMDNEENSTISILEFSNHPVSRVVSYSTLGLSDHFIPPVKNEKPTGVEVVAVCRNDYTVFANILSTIAFYQINSRFPIYPGMIYEGVISLYSEIKTQMKHILFVYPTAWKTEFKALDFEDVRVTWMMAIPISDEENQYAKDNGFNALGHLLEKNKIDVYDLCRKSVL
jgi:antitoxin YqcF